MREYGIRREEEIKKMLREWKKSEERERGGDDDDDDDDDDDVWVGKRNTVRSKGGKRKELKERPKKWWKIYWKLIKGGGVEGRCEREEKEEEEDRERKEKREERGGIKSSTYICPCFPGILKLRYWIVLELGHQLTDGRGVCVGGGGEGLIFGQKESVMGYELQPIIKRFNQVWPGENVLWVIGFSLNW